MRPWFPRKYTTDQNLKTKKQRINHRPIIKKHGDLWQIKEKIFKKKHKNKATYHRSIQKIIKLTLCMLTEKWYPSTAETIDTEQKSMKKVTHHTSCQLTIRNEVHNNIP